MTPNLKGDIALYEVILRAMKKGIVVSRPIADDARYDLVFDEGGTQARVQVKYCGHSQANGSYTVGLDKHTGGYNRRRYLYAEECFDLLIVYLAPEDRFAVLSEKHWCGRHNVTIRTQPALNGQKKGINFIEDVAW